MATVKLDWQQVSTDDPGLNHRCEFKARNGGGALVMNVRKWGVGSVTAITASAYYWLEVDQRRIPLYDDENWSDRLDDAKKALEQWYSDNAPTLLLTLAG